ncbi:MAG: type IV pilus modification protein PilV [Haliea sp.]|nr:type IV pilus modification protein PilV [Haliea sp.]
MHPATVRGFTLLEVMISLVVLAIGVMGVIGLQTATYQQLQTSQNFSKAAMLAGDMADRMLANQENVLATAYVHNAPPAEPDTDCTTAACTTPPNWRPTTCGAGRQSCSGETLMMMMMMMIQRYPAHCPMPAAK